MYLYLYPVRYNQPTPSRLLLVFTNTVETTGDVALIIVPLVPKTKAKVSGGIPKYHLPVAGGK